MPIRAVRPCRFSFAVLVASLAFTASPAVAASHASRGHHVVKTTKSAQASAKTTKSAQASAVVSSACVDTDLVPTTDNVARVTASTLCLVNRERVSAGLSALHDNAVLTKTATSHTSDMVDANFFDHTGSAGDTVLSRDKTAGYLRSGFGYSIGENIAAATGSLATPAQIVAGWMNSGGHRANILNPSFRDSGIGVVPAAPALLGSGPGATYTQDFGEIG